MTIQSTTTRRTGPIQTEAPAPRALQQPRTAAELREQVRVQTGIAALNHGDGMGAAEPSPFDAIVQMGLNHTALTDVQERFIGGLNEHQIAGLRGVASAVSANVVVGQRANNLPDSVQASWADAVGAVAGRGGQTDVNAIVQFVLRESYMESSRDLYTYAEKVKFFNSSKKAIRDELQRARDTLVGYAGAEGSAPLEPPFVTNPPNTEFTGSSSLVIDPAAKEAQAALAAAQGQLNQNSSGNGVQMLTPQQRAALNPAPMANTFVTTDAAGKALYRIDYEGTEVKIYAPPGPDGRSQLISHIWGDPHVDESAPGAGDDWHFGEDSTFILPDGTKVSLNTEETTPGVFVTKGIDIQSGNQHAFAGIGLDGQNRQAGVAYDRATFDAAQADTKGTSGGVFALQANGEWAVLAGDGKFYDVANMDWGTYLQQHRVSAQGNPVTVSSQAELAGRDHLASMVADLQAAIGEAAKHGEVLTTKEGLDNYIKTMEERLSSVGDDAQLANVDLQNMLQKQQQTMQMMSNISKMLNDTALAIVRKIG